MTNYIEIAKSLGITKEFGVHVEDSCVEEDDISHLLYQEFDKDFNVMSGATKIVIFEDNSDYVLKIPFYGRIEFIYTEDNNWWEEEEFIPFDSAYGSMNNDYCNAEIEIYEKVMKEAPQFLPMFVRTEKIYSDDNFSAYIQKKVTTNGDLYKNKLVPTPSFKSYEHADNARRSYRYSHLPHDRDWIARAYEFYGYDYVTDFLKYLDSADNKMFSDFHGGNLGYLETGAPVIFDYAGYHEE